MIGGWTDIILFFLVVVVKALIYLFIFYWFAWFLYHGVKDGSFLYIFLSALCLGSFFAKKKKG